MINTFVPAEKRQSQHRSQQWRGMCFWMARGFAEFHANQSSGSEDETLWYSKSRADFSFGSWIMRFHTLQRCWWFGHLSKLIISNLICVTSWLRPYLLCLYICRDVVGFSVLNLPHLHDTDLYGANNFATIWSSATKNKWNAKVRIFSLLKLQQSSHHPQFRILWFHLPASNCSPKILNGKSQKQTTLKF